MLKAGVAMVLAIVLLSVFTFIYSHSGVHITNETGATDYKWKSNQFRANMSEGFSWMRMNADGFNNAFDLSDKPNINILLMGSSHMEAVNIPTDKNVGYLLNDRMPEWITYNIGISGHTIYQCANNLSNAVAYYNPKDYIVMETDRVVLEVNKMADVIDGRFSRIPSHDNGLVYKVQEYIPCLLPLYREMKNWMSAGNLAPAADNIKNEDMADKQHTEEYEIMLDRFLSKIREDAGDCKVVIFYHPETMLDESGEILLKNSEEAESFAAACSKNDIEFINMYDDFKNAFITDHVLAHGFSNTAVGSGHLNIYGHELIANRLIMLIREN